MPLAGMNGLARGLRHCRRGLGGGRHMLQGRSMLPTAWSSAGRARRCGHRLHRRSRVAQLQERNRDRLDRLPDLPSSFSLAQSGPQDREVLRFLRIAQFDHRRVPGIRIRDRPIGSDCPAPAGWRRASGISVSTESRSPAAKTQLMAPEGRRAGGRCRSAKRGLCPARPAAPRGSRGPWPHPAPCRAGLRRASRH